VWPGRPCSCGPGVRLVGAEGALAALVCGGGVGLGAREAEAVRFCCCRVDEARAELVLWTRRAGHAGVCIPIVFYRTAGIEAAVEIFVADATQHAIVALRLRRLEEQRRPRRARLAFTRHVESAARAPARRVVVVREGRIRCLVAHRARLAVVGRVKRKNRGRSVRGSWTISALRSVKAVSVLASRARDARVCAVLTIAPLAQTHVLRRRRRRCLRVCLAERTTGGRACVVFERVYRTRVALA